jgi:hypothetical protein
MDLLCSDASLILMYAFPRIVWVAFRGTETAGTGSTSKKSQNLAVSAGQLVDLLQMPVHVGIVQMAIIESVKYAWK